MQAFKSYSSRALNRAEPERKRWTRHGSTRWIWKDGDVQEAIRYVVIWASAFRPGRLRESPNLV